MNLPYSYLWSYLTAIGEAKTILDLGTDDGQFMNDIGKGKNWIIDGIEIYKPSFNKAKESEVYRKTWLGDVELIAKELISKKQKYDVVLCSQVLEHLDKNKGKRILKLAEKLATKRIVFALPISFMNQPVEFLKGNPYQAHRSGWSIDELRGLGFTVHGMGIKFLWSENGICRTLPKEYRLPFVILGYIFAPLCYYFPHFASGMIAVKEI
ncbi:class I SAM-dependent methyltransferase [Candidatus Amesbacteria bacterium]|nr:class I SAM-dependent methyltransferase [Candidatus Amesbacteria bacterium]